MLNAIIMKRKKNRVCLAFYTLKHYGKENNACIFKATPITEQKNMKLCKITEFCHRFRNALYLNTDNMWRTFLHFAQLFNSLPENF